MTILTLHNGQERGTDTCVRAAAQQRPARPGTERRVSQEPQSQAQDHQPYPVLTGENLRPQGGKQEAIASTQAAEQHVFVQREAAGPMNPSHNTHQPHGTLFWDGDRF